jgi:hypothetical protein
MSFVRDYNTLPQLPGGPTNNSTPLPAIPVQRTQNSTPYDIAPPGAGIYSSLNNATIDPRTVARRPPMPLPVTFSVSPYENIGGRRLRKTTRRHRKTKHCRRLNKKKSKKSKKRT